MIIKQVESDSNRLQSLDELRFALDVNMEIQIKINGIEWYIGSDHKGNRIISKDNGNFNYHFKFNDDTDEVLNYVIDGKRIRDQWRDIIIVSM